MCESRTKFIVYCQLWKCAEVGAPSRTIHGQNTVEDKEEKSISATEMDRSFWVNGQLLEMEAKVCVFFFKGQTKSFMILPRNTKMRTACFDAARFIRCCCCCCRRRRHGEAKRGGPSTRDDPIAWLVARPLVVLPYPGQTPCRPFYREIVLLGRWLDGRWGWAGATTTRFVVVVVGVAAAAAAASL